MNKLFFVVVAALALVAAAAPRKLLQGPGGGVPECSKEDIVRYPSELDAFTGAFSWGYNGNATCYFVGPAPERPPGPGDGTPECTPEQAAASPLAPDASGGFSWGWTGSASCWAAIATTPNP